MKRSVFLHIADVLRFYPSYEQSIEQCLQTVPYTPVEDRSARNMVKYKHAVDNCIANSDTLTNEVIRLLYFERNPNLSNEGIAMELHIDRATLYRHRDRFFERMRKEIGW